MPTIIRVQLVPEHKYIFTVSFSTNHSLLSTCKNLRRSLTEFYWLQSNLKVKSWNKKWLYNSNSQKRFKNAPTLPVKPIMWMSSHRQRISTLARFLTRLFSNKELMNDEVNSSYYKISNSTLLMTFIYAFFSSMLKTL